MLNIYAHGVIVEQYQSLWRPDRRIGKLIIEFTSNSEGEGFPELK